MSTSPRQAPAPWRAAATSVAAGYVLLTLTMLGAGFVLVHVVLHGAVGRFDERAAVWLAAHRSAPLDTVTGFATALANTEGIVVVAAVVVVLFVRAGRHADACVPVLALVVELAVFLSTTYAVGRPRPDVPRLDSTPSTDSFPSGHTAATLALYGAIAVLLTRDAARRPWRAPALVLVLALDALVAFARAYRGMHHVTDVLGGAVLGVLALAVAVHAVDRARVAARVAPSAPTVAEPAPRGAPAEVGS